uniref:Uncharacterized protein n=1 Tax=Timema monikensis TaxID=170555 RepID=A0A7R9EB43_9NEOP|nr:unnamed protein product [Timema monikensis]
MASLVLTDSSQLTADSQHLGVRLATDWMDDDEKVKICISAECARCGLPIHPSHANVKEVIDALETQLGDTGLRGGVRGVRAQSGECYICLSRQQEAQSLLRSGLGLRGHHLTLLDVSRDSLVVCLSGVPHHVTDTAVALLAASFGTVIDIIGSLFIILLETTLERKNTLDTVPTSADNKPFNATAGHYERDYARASPEHSPGLGHPPQQGDGGHSKGQSVGLNQTGVTRDSRATGLRVSTLDYTEFIPCSRSFVTHNKVCDGRGDRRLLQRDRLGEVERRLYKGVDTGERLLRVKPNPGVDQLPPAVSLAGSKVKLRVLPPEEVAALGHAGDLPLTTSPEPPTSSTQYGDDQRACSSSSDNSLNGDSRFKSHLNVRLKQPDTASTPNILPNTASLAPSQPPFFSTLPSTRKGPQWPTMDAEHQQVPRNPFSADYQATLPSNARLSSSDSSALAGNANPFTYPAHPNFDSEYVLPSPGPNPSGGRIPHQTISGHVPPPVIAPGTPLTHRPTPAPSYLNPNAVLISPTHKNLTAEKQLDALSPQSNSTPSSPINSRQQRLSKKAGGPPHARSFDETMPSSASPLLGRRVNISSPITIHKKERMSRKTSGNSVSSQPSADDGEALPPSLAASTPTSQKKNSRKISVNVSEVHPQSNADASRCSSSSGQDSPTKSDRRRRVSVYFNKKGGGRRDSNVVGNGTRSLSASRYGPGEGGEATTSDRERTNSVSSRTSSATGGGRRKLSKSSNRALDVGDNKVPWCGCWGNGCI